MTGKNYRIWHIQNLPNDPIYYYCESPEQAEQAIRWLIELDLMREDIESNAFGLEVRIVITGDVREWEEWENEDGQNIVELIDEHSEAGGE